MISWIFSTLLVPLFPALEDPRQSYATQMAELSARLERSKQATVQKEDAPSEPRLSSTPMPQVTGRVFERRMSTEVSELEDVSVDVLSALSLTGIVQSDGRRFAIVSDGQADHVVAAGSYLLGAARVAQVNPDSLLLVLQAGANVGKQVELHLRGGQAEGMTP
ncbi:MAG TPA: hypothetical protein VFV39_00715 [Limnobacter sp.]|nr:hypothetical protein [Limnobacter sp.]